MTLKRWLYLAGIVWSALVFFLPISPLKIEKVGTPQPEGIQFIIPAVLFFVACWYELFPNLKIWKLLNRKFWIIASLVVLGYVGIAWMIDATSDYYIYTIGSHNTLGIFLLLFAFTLYHAKLNEPRSWFLGATAVFASIGIWESFYQIGVWADYYHEWFPLKEMLYNEILVWRPHPLMAIPFIGLTIYYAKRFGFRLSKWVIVPCVVFVVYWLTWYFTGYWVIWYADHNQVPTKWIFNTPVNWVWYLGTRSTKVIFAVIQLYFIAGIQGLETGKHRLTLQVIYLVAIILAVYVVIKGRIVF